MCPKGGVSCVKIEFVGVSVVFDNTPRIFFITKLSEHF